MAKSKLHKGTSQTILQASSDQWKRNLTYLMPDHLTNAGTTQNFSLKYFLILKTCQR